MVGIKDIAKKAGVSISTVSYALNGSPKVTEETRTRIQAIANELNYVPNMAARTLKRQETRIIGVYLSTYSGSFYGELLDGIKQGLAIKGYEMIVCSGKQSHLFIPERMIDGGIVLDWEFKSEEILQYADRGYQLVVLDRLLEDKRVPSVLLDNRGGAALAIQQFIELGSDKVYLLSGPTESHDATERLDTSVKELERYGISYEVIQGDFTNKSGIEAAISIFSEMPTIPVDIFALNDEMAIGIYKQLEKTDLIIGKDVRIIGFDNSELADIIRPRLATIGYSKNRWGMIAAEKIVQLISEEEVNDEHIYTTYVAGESFPI